MTDKERQLLASFLTWAKFAHDYHLMREGYNWTPPYTAIELIDQFTEHRNRKLAPPDMPEVISPAITNRDDTAELIELLEEARSYFWMANPPLSGEFEERVDAALARVKGETP